jgi:hypothetical protein
MPTRGIRFYRSSVRTVPGADAPIFLHGRIEEHRSDFDFIFRCLYRGWESKFLLADNSFIYSEDADPFGGALMWSNVSAGHVVLRASVLDRVGPNVNESEGSELLIFNKPPPASMTWQQYRDLTGPVTGPNIWPDDLHCLAHNWDGIYWEIFSEAPEEYQRLLTAHSQVAALKAYWVDFQHDYPNPRECQLEVAWSERQITPQGT